MKKLIYKGIVFDDFQLYNGDTGDYGDYNSESLNKFNSANVYVCPHCIKKYNLYAECGVFKEEIEKEIAETEYNGITFGNHHQDLTCGVKECYNKNSYDCMFNTENCQLIDYKEETINKTFNFKEEKEMKVVVLTWGKQDEMGRVFYHDNHVELFKTEEAAQIRALELGKEFVPEAKNTEELVEGLIALEDNSIPSLLFDIDIIEM